MSRLGTREFWVPGLRQGMVFVLLVFLGLGAWAVKAALLRPIVGDRLLFSLLDAVFDSGIVLYAVLALASGFLAPKGFYMWGIAIVLSHPFAALAQAAYHQSRGLELVRGGAEGWASYALVLAMMTFATAVFVTTPLSAAGAGLRLLSDHLRRGRAGASRDVQAR